VALGFALPFSRSTGSLGHFEATQDEISAWRASALSLLSTNWGERPNRYYLGCNLVEYCFEQRTTELRGRISDRIESQFSKWLPFLVVKRSQVFFSEDEPKIPENGIGVFLELSPSNRPDVNIPVAHVVLP
jgi:hypothetical protein